MLKPNVGLSQRELLVLRPRRRNIQPAKESNGLYQTQLDLPIGFWLQWKATTVQKARDVTIDRANCNRAPSATLAPIVPRPQRYRGRHRQRSRRGHFQPSGTGLPGTPSVEKALPGLLDRDASLNFQRANPLVDSRMSSSDSSNTFIL